MLGKGAKFLVALMVPGLLLMFQAIALAEPASCVRDGVHNAASASLTYRQRTEQAVRVFTTAAGKIRAGNHNEVASELINLKASLCELQITSEHFRKLAKINNQRCSGRAEELHDRIAWLYQNQQDNESNLEKITASLERAVTNAGNVEQQRATLLADLRKTREDLALRKQRLDELNKWWWVPGYGQFLAIRELVEKDSARTGGLIQDIKKLEQLVGSQATNLSQLRSLSTELKRNQETAEWSGQQLIAMRNQVREQLGESKNLFLFLADAEKFWDEGSSLNLDSISTSIKRIEALHKKLQEGRVVRSLDDRTLRLTDQLLRFASRADQNSQFFLEEGDSYCSLTEKTDCPAGYTYDKENQFCWTDCPGGFKDEAAAGSGISAACQKPLSFDTKFSPARGVYESTISVFTPVLTAYEDVLNKPESPVPAAKRQEIIKALETARAELKKLVDLGATSCSAVNVETCKVLDDGFNWRPECPEHFELLNYPMTRQYPPPPRRPPMCLPVCPPDMVDLGSVCGKTHLLPH